MKREQLIVALDAPNWRAREIRQELGDLVDTYKIGSQLFTEVGPDAIRELRAIRKRIFLDLKYHDIPNTVEAAVTEAAMQGVNMLTVHAAGDRTMLRAAVQAARDVNPDMAVLAVTVLTSLDQSSLERTGVHVQDETQPVERQVLRLADLAITSGCDGVVASPFEVAALRKNFGEEILIVTPGVRLPDEDHNDQARVMTPDEAIAAGANFVVMGRSIVNAINPREVVLELTM